MASSSDILKFHASRFWAIQLHDTYFRKWKHQEDSSRIKFEWNEIEISGFAPYNDISIAVAKKFPNEDVNEIKSIAYGIHHFPKLKIGDGILGVEGTNTVKRVGAVISIEHDNDFFKSVDVEIKWINEIKEGYSSTYLFDEGLQIQKITQRMLNNLRMPLELTREEWVGSGFSGESDYFASKYLQLEPFISMEHLRDWQAFDLESIGISDVKDLGHVKLETLTSRTGEQFQNFKLKPITAEDGGNFVELFYGTNRHNTGSNEANSTYDYHFEAVLKLGICRVKIPEKHKQGVIERPNWLKLQFTENEKNHIVLKNVDEMSEDKFLEIIANGLEKKEKKEALIFIHGVSNSFSSAAWRSAQIATDLKFKGIAGFFSWPCQEFNVPLMYTRDMERAEASKRFFADFLELIIQKTKVERIHLIAHSMGNRVLTACLEDLSHRASLSRKLAIFNQIILGAPDIDQTVFETNFLSILNAIGLRRTLYASSNDLPITISRWKRFGLQRLGDGGEKNIFVSPGIDSIDASNVPNGILDHAYIFETEPLIKDLVELLENNTDPILRGLSEAAKSNMPYWLFPEQ